tara:strand:- start:29 stop:259 length:231 start_codon:yes stop_codon:yes gene_type:complete
MKYSQQVQAAMERLDRSLLALNKLIRAGQKQEALEFMEQGPLKDSYEDLQNIITLAGGPGSASGIGGGGTVQTGTF